MGTYARLRLGRNNRLDTLDFREVHDWHDWLSAHHLESSGVMLVFHKGGAPSLTYDEALDEALAYGWIDSVIRRIDEERYVRKFSPRRPGSVWSTLNVRRVARLRRVGRMTKWGLEAFSRRTPDVSLLEQYNAGRVEVSPEFEEVLKKNKKAWVLYQKMTPSHRKRYAVWIATAKKPETRKRRIAEAVKLVEAEVRELLK